MEKKIIILLLTLLSFPLFAAKNDALGREIKQLQQQTRALQAQLVSMQKQLKRAPKRPPALVRVKKPATPYHSSLVSVHMPKNMPEGTLYFPSALVADSHVLTYIAGTPVVTSPYTGEMPAFDGSDYIVNISSINRDIRLMEQRRRLYDSYAALGYPLPPIPIVALSGKAEPVAFWSSPYIRHINSDVSLGSTELDVAAMLNPAVEMFFSIAYDDSPPDFGPRVTNSAFDLNLGFVNIGNLDRSPIYFTGGQLFVPFGRYSTSMISSPLPLILARTKTRPFILGYKSPAPCGPYAAIYTFISETTEGHPNIVGYNAGYIIRHGNLSGDIGAGLIGTIADAAGMQLNGAAPFTTFGGFGSITNGSEAVGKIPGIDAHANFSFLRYSLTAEWVQASRPFHARDLSFNDRGAKPKALQLEAGVTFITVDKPASLSVGYQWSQDALALRMPRKRFIGVYNISIWKDTVESLEYRHDIDYPCGSFANGATAPGQINANTRGTGKSADTVTLQIGVYF